MKTAPTLSVEEACWSDGFVLVCGMDEVGRGAWLGPVTVGAVVAPVGLLPKDSPLHDVRDSKDLTQRKRDELVPHIQEWAQAYGVGHASAAECDALGMTAALRLAGSRALTEVRATLEVDYILLDGPHDYLKQGIPTKPIIKGDASSVTIAAASVLAKVSRDAVMSELSDAYPAYDLGKNKGYPSPKHRAAIADVGLCEQHRHSWSFARPPHEQPALF